MDVNPIGSVEARKVDASSQADRMGLGRDAFMKLLLAQLRYQDPLQPMDDTDFIAQLAQLNTLEQLERLNQSFEGFMEQQNLMRGAELIGRTVSAMMEGEGIVEGIVSAAKFRNGEVILVIDGTEVSLQSVLVVQE
jgi:flagellar basal-body rod modification protein FlgD